MTHALAHEKPQHALVDEVVEVAPRPLVEVLEHFQLQLVGHQRLHLVAHNDGDGDDGRNGAFDG